MGTAARATVMPRSWDAIFDALMSDYEQLIRRNGGACGAPPRTRLDMSKRTAQRCD